MEPRVRATLPRDGTITLVLGRPGMGKTTLFGRLVARDVLRDGRRAVLLDYTGDTLARVVGESASKGAGVPRDWCRKAHDAAGVWAAFDGRADSIFAPQPRAMVVSMQLRAGQDPKHLAAEFLAVMDAERARGLVFVCDQAEQLFPNKAAEGAGMRALAWTRNRQQTLYAASHRAAILSTLLRSNATHALIYCLRSARDIAALSDFGEPEEFAAATQLPQFVYLHAPGTRPPGAPLRRLHTLADPLPV